MQDKKKLRRKKQKRKKLRKQKVWDGSVSWVRKSEFSYVVKWAKACEVRCIGNIRQLRRYLGGGGGFAEYLKYLDNGIPRNFIYVEIREGGGGGRVGEVAEWARAGVGGDKRVRGGEWG